MRMAIPKIQSYQRHVTPRSVLLGNLLAGKSLTFTACSRYCASTAHLIGSQWVIIPNGVPVEKYHFSSSVPSNAPLVFLSRLERIKGVHTAIEVARKTKRELIIAGNHAASGDESAYFYEEILPHCDGKRIRYIGPIGDFQKDEILGNAAALLFPVQWEEPFGIVMVESLACGTPVIAFERGSVPEVIEHGKTGFICHSIDEMVEAVKNIPRIDRGQCRKRVEERFSDKVIVDEYEKLYYSHGNASG
jgi:glycosyltransferase involved in cell wall biosynthesis